MLMTRQLLDNKGADDFCCRLLGMDLESDI